MIRTSPSCSNNVKSKVLILALVLFFFVSFHVDKIAGQVEPGSYLNKFSQEYKNAKNDSLRIDVLANLASFYLNYLDDKILADSVSEVALEIADKSLLPGIQIFAITRYIQSNNLEMYPEKALLYAKKSLELAGKTHNLRYEWRGLKNVDTVYLVNKEYDVGYDFSTKALNIATKLKNDSVIVESYLDIGEFLEGRNEKLAALKIYIKALDLSKRMYLSSLLKKCYHELAKFYNRVGLINQAAAFRDSERILVMNRRPVDSIALMWIQYDRLSNDFDNKNNPVLDKDIKYVVDFAIRHGAKRLKRFEFAVYRSHLLSADSINKLYDLYYNMYPSELRLLFSTDPAMFCRLKAFFTEKENKIDSATFYFNKAEKLMRPLYPSIRSQFYYRFAQFLIRHGRKMEAIDKLHKSYQLAEDGHFLVNMLSASELLDSLYAQMGDYKNAYFYSLQNKKLADNIHEWSKTEQLFRTQIEHDDQQRKMEAALAKEKSEKEIKVKKTQRDMMAGGVASLILISFIIYRYYRNQKRSNKLLDIAKKQSDNLLLNILPYETAEELKLTGTAKAKRFEEVTIMFTDFKGFTRVSELLGAEDLVKLVDIYFSEFDKIIARHNIEKIKIIGDSYMCAGGLPIVNKTHACDVVSAALEMQEFMTVQKNERSSRGEVFVDLRIGINTGHVVAGIVGLKKFAYDIWGDSVNIASRMESSGEPGKVNVSGYTYELIKHQFHCTYRGKIEAKNKGMIDMYFVDTN